MADENGFRKSILIPLSRYQQLLQYQNKTTKASPLTSTQKEKQPSDESSKSNNVMVDNSLRTDYKTDTSSVKPLEHHTEEPLANDDDDDTHESEMERKILHTINSSFSNPLREKLSRLFLYIINFGVPLITFNEHGNVLFRNRVVGGQTNILDLLHACVSATAVKPAGYDIFIEALQQINVPKHFLHGHSFTVQTPPQNTAQKGGKTKRKTKIENWQTY